MFRRYVEEGGKLLITGQSGQFDRMGGPHADEALAELIGAEAALVNRPTIGCVSLRPLLLRLRVACAEIGRFW